MSRMTTRRNNVPKDIGSFKKLFTQVEKLLTIDKSQERKVAGDEAYELSQDVTELHAFIKSLGWSLTRFECEWRTNFQLMATPEFDRSHRLAERRGARMLVMSGLTWNNDSHAHNRDWTTTVAAITLETGLVELYRERLLRNCRGVLTLRDEIQEYFMTITAYHHVKVTRGAPSRMVKDWEFPDGYGLPEGLRTGTSTGTDTGVGAGALREEDFNSGDLRKKLDEVHPTKEKSRGRGKGSREDPSIIEDLFKSKLLQCSDPNQTGSMETLAYHCVEFLHRVCHSPCLLQDTSPMTDYL